MSYKRAGSPNWWASYIERGQRIRHSTGTTDINEAKALEFQWRAQAHREQHWDVKAPRQFEEVKLEYLRGSAELRSLETIKYRVRTLLKYFAGRVANDLTGQDIKGYARWRIDQGASKSTVNRELAVVSAAINHANEEWEWSLPNPVKGRMMREPRHRERYLTKAEVGRLVAEARKLKHGDLLADFIELAVYTGCRRGELLELEWARVSLERSNEGLSLGAQHTKTGKPRTVPLNAIAAQAVRRRQAWRAEYAPATPWVFARPGDGQVKSIRNGFQKAAKNAGLTDIRIHDLRHTAASWLVSDGVPLEVVKELLGHSSITMTERYAHLAPHRVREAVNRISHNPVTANNPEYALGEAKRQETLKKQGGADGETRTPTP